jgi:23S rRNA (adenine2503-C2)-methyltransferase
MKEALFGKTLYELTELTDKAGLPKFTARQIADWLYKKDISGIEEMTNLTKKARKILSNTYTTGLTHNVQVQTSSDGTKKYLFPVQDKSIESAFIPEKSRNTLCVSTQVGCKMACTFCMTGKQGFQGNLSAGEILNQFQSLPERDSLTNIVYMGMGEPLDNLNEVLKSLEILTSDWGYGWSPRRITVSSIGIISALRTYLEKSSCGLAISMHTPFDEERKRLMPVQKTNPIREIIKIIRDYPAERQRKISFEYILFKGINDTPRHVEEISKLLRGFRCRVNLIRFHSIPGSRLRGCSMEEMEQFRDRLNEKGITATIRKSRGEDIAAACGLLSTKAMS